MKQEKLLLLNSNGAKMRNQEPSLILKKPTKQQSKIFIETILGNL